LTRLQQVNMKYATDIWHYLTIM